MAWYRSGTVSVTSGSNAVVGTSTQWVAQAKAGDVFTVDGVTWYEISAITDDTHLTLQANYAGTTNATATYAIIRNFNSSTAADIASSLSILMNRYHTTLDEMVAWLTESGDVELTDALGVEHTVPSVIKIGAMIGVQTTKDLAGSTTPVSLSLAESSAIFMVFTGARTANVDIVFPDSVGLFGVFNNTTGAYTLTVKTASGTGVAITQGKRAILYCDGVNVVDADNDIALDGVQPLDATLTALSGLTVATDKLIYATGPDAFSTCDLTAAGRSIIGASSATAQRTALELGTSATQNVNAMAITGGTINGTTVGATTAATGKFTAITGTSLGVTVAGAAANSFAGTTSNAAPIALSTGSTAAAPVGVTIGGTLSPSGTVSAMGININCPITPSGASLGALYGVIYGVSSNNSIQPTTWTQSLVRANFGSGSSGTCTNYYGQFCASPNLAAGSAALITNHIQFYAATEGSRAVTGNAIGYQGAMVDGSNTIATVARASDVATVVFDAAHVYAVGKVVTIASVITDTGFNGAQTVLSVPSSTSITFANAGSDLAATDYGGTSTCTGRWNAYLSGNAPNYILGKLLLGTATNNNVDQVQINGSSGWAGTITATGTTGDRTINKPAGRVNIAAGGTTVTVTNSLVTANTLIFPVVATNDTTAKIKNCVAGAGSFVINMEAAVTAETAIAFQILNII